MTYGREKRLLLGVAALAAPLPLPWNEMLEWPVLALFLAVVLLFLRRAASPVGAGRWLSNRALNLLGLAYLPVLVADVGITGRIQLLRPVLHLTLFAVAAKLWSLTEEKHKWQTWIGIFFLFLASMATSVHPSIVLYLAFFVALTVVLMLRFVHLHALAAFGHREGPAPRLPVRAFTVATVAATLLLAVPLFAFLPRVRSPYILGPGGSGQGELPRAGFSDEMSLDLIGRIRDNAAVAMRLRFTGRTSPPGAMRFKAATYETWEGRSWRRSPRARPLLREPREGVFRLAAGRPEAAATIYLEPLRTSSLVFPTETLTLELPLAALDVDRGGALFLRGMPHDILEYRVTLGGSERSIAAEPRAASSAGADEDGAGRPAELDLTGITPRMAALAAEWAGDGDDLTRARRIERHLLFEYGYSLEFIGRGGAEPLEHFLFGTRRGHCEYFASSMVLLLRAAGIPARLVTGFLGAEYSAWERAWLVRQSHAHAWVEGYVPGTGWVAFDPTPPAGRPQAEPDGLLSQVRQAYEFLMFRWDRYVLSFDFYDQVGLFFQLRALWEQLSQELFKAATRAARDERAPDAPAVESSPAANVERDRFRFLEWTTAIAAIGLTVGGWLLWRQRRGWSRTRAYETLLDTLRGSGVAIPPWSGPLAVRELASERFPAAAPAASRLIQGYLRESFAGEVPPGDARESARRDLFEVEAAIRATRAAVKYSKRRRGAAGGRKGGRRS